LPRDASRSPPSTRPPRSARPQTAGLKIIFFSVIQKKVVSPNDFPALEKLSETLLAFVDRYNQTARPFSWKYTAGDLKDLLRRISEHDNQDARQQTDLTEAAAVR